MTTYQWVIHHGQRLYEVGIQPDGTLHNPRGYPDDAVRAAVLAADARRHERRSEAAVKAGKTRARRRALRINKIVVTYGGQPVGPRSHCIVCERHLDDAQSIQRGIGPECWQDVLAEIEKAREAA